MIRDLGRGTAPLDGPWQFHPGDDPAWASPGFNDSGWEQLTADKPWGLQGHESYAGIAWYRRKIIVNQAPEASPDLSLLVPHVQSAYEIYWNGVLIGQVGKLPPLPVFYTDRSPHSFHLRGSNAGVLAVRVWKSPFIWEEPGIDGGFSAAPQIGSAKAIAAAQAQLDYARLRSNQVSFAEWSLCGLVALLSLAGWIRDRQQRLLFWMACFCLGPVITGLIFVSRISVPYSVAAIVTHPAFAITDVSLWFILLWLLNLHEDQRLLRMTRIAAFINLSASTINGPMEGAIWISQWTHVAHVAYAVLETAWVLTEPVALVLIVVAVLRHRRLAPASWLLALSAFVFQMLWVSEYVSREGIRFTHWTLTGILEGPLFSIAGSPINIHFLTHTALFFSILYAMFRTLAEDRRRQRTLEQEFQNARELQRVLIPDDLPEVPGFALTSAYKPALEVGGDFFQIIPVKDLKTSTEFTMVVLGDVSGHGLRAAMAVSLIVGAIRMATEMTSSPADILAGLNRRLDGRLKGGFATALALRLSPDGGCTIACAGHPAPFLNDEEATLPPALPLGLVASATYEETTFRLGAGDRLILYTDGLLEARGSSGELFSFERLQALFASGPTAAEATAAAVAFGQEDDITVLTLTRLATGEESSAIHTSPALAPA